MSLIPVYDMSTLPVICPQDHLINSLLCPNIHTYISLIPAHIESVFQLTLIFKLQNVYSQPSSNHPTNHRDYRNPFDTIDTR